MPNYQEQKILPINIFIFNFLFFFFITPCISTGKTNLIKIALKKSVSKVTISSEGRFLKIDYNNKTEYFSSHPGIKVRMLKSKFIINGKEKGEDFITISNRKKHLFIDGVGYKGKIIIVNNNNNNSFIIINEVDIEKYLKGVLSNEVPYKWNKEILKVQAIIARTYALYLKSKKKNTLYHLEPSVTHQMYKGSDTETKRTNWAVDKTFRLVLTYNKQLALSVYHSVCGGHTENALHVWEGPNIDYLKGVKCNFDKAAPRFNWELKISLTKIRNLLNKEGMKIGKIIHIVPKIYTKSNRILKLEIVHLFGKKIIDGTLFRKIIGWDKIRSTLFKINIKNNFAEIKGNGSGHGVGLCQWGAKGMAELGYNYKQILKNYYPGVKLSKWKY